MIFHPGITDRSKAAPSLATLEFGRVNSDFNNFNATILPLMRLGMSGTTTFVKNGQTWYISYSLANTPKYPTKGIQQHLVRKQLKY